MKSWCKTLPPTSIHSFIQFIDEFMSSFQESNCEDFFKEIDEFIMRLDESMDGFFNRTLNIYYRILEKGED